MKGYRNYENENINFNKIFAEYQNTKITQKELCEKNNIPLTTFNTRYMKYKLMCGGNLKKLSENEQNKKIEKNKNIMEVMNNAGKRGGGNKHSGFTDIIEEQNKKKIYEQSQQPKKKNVVSLENMYNISGIFNEADKISKEND